MDKEQHLEADEQNVPLTPSPGQVLREAREAQGLSQKEIADKMYLREEIISGIEDNYLDDKTSITFVKGYVRLYAKTVGLHQEELIALFEQYHTAPKPPAKLQSFSRKVAKQAHDDRWMMVTYGILLILFAGVVVWWFQQSNLSIDIGNAVSPPSSEEQESTASPVTLNSPDIQQDAASLANRLPSDAELKETSTAMASADEQAADSASALTTLTEPIDTDANDARLTETGSGEITLVTNQDGNQENAPVDSALPVFVVFTFSDDCWVNVKDASGEAIAYGVKASGYTMPISGVPPFEVTLGAPSVVAITYSGKAIDMSGFDPTRTAKFTLPLQE